MMAQMGRDRLTGRVEADEALIGGIEEGGCNSEQNRTRRLRAFVVEPPVRRHEAEPPALVQEATCIREEVAAIDVGAGSRAPTAAGDPADTPTHSRVLRT